MVQLKHPWQCDEITIGCNVHTFIVTNLEDPDLYAAHPMYEWQQTEVGKWVMASSEPSPSWHQTIDKNSLTYKYVIRAYFTPADYTYWKLKYD